MIEIIKAAFFAGEIKTFLIQGEYVEILEAAYPIDIAMLDRSGVQLSVMRSAEASYFSRPGKYEVIQVTSASAQTVRLFVGSGDAGTRRTSGVVEVIDGGYSTTRSKNAFFKGGQATAGVGQFWAYGVWNLSTTKNLRIKKMRYIVAGANGGFSARLVAVNVLPGASDGFAVNKFIGAAASTAAELRALISSPNALTGITDSIFLDVNPTTQVLDFQEPILLPPGTGLFLTNNVALTAVGGVSVFFELNEDTV